MRARAAIALAIALSACEKGPPPPLSPTTSPRFHAVWQIATHNSYWVDRGVADAFASGVEERMSDQLLFDGARSLEIDVHRSDTPGEYDVYHTTMGNSLCTTLGDCLGSLRVTQRALPEHEVVTIVLELKELFDPLFDDAHRVEDLDAILERELGPFLYRPSDFLARCPGIAALADCAEQTGWPTIEELRGRFIVAILGNWDSLGGQNTHAWATYATTGSIAERAAFPMASSWKLDFDALPSGEQRLTTREEIAAAERQSVFLQIEELADPRIDPWLARRAVVRVDGAFDEAAQNERIARGLQLLQTDYPWIHARPDDLARVFVALAPDDFDASELVEPGTRFLLDAGAPVFAWWTPEGPGTWEAAIVSGNASERSGCLRAEAEPPLLDSIEVCRSKVDADRTGSGPADAEAVIVRVVECHAGACTTTEHRESGDAPAAWGDLVGLAIDGTCARALVASEVGVDVTPRWTELVTPCFDAPLVRQGIARAADAPATAAPTAFIGVRRDGEPVRAADVAGVRSGTQDDASRLIDASGQ